MDLASKAVIVTGSSSGIGAAIARRLAGLGAGIVVNSASSVEAGQRVAAELGDAVYVQGDVGDPATAAALVSAAEQRWGRLDGLVNNAGVTVDVQGSRGTGHAAAPGGQPRGHRRSVRGPGEHALRHRPDLRGRRRARAHDLIMTILAFP
jgi:NAD(P)-dependent dehydrogenase (short-subunit alcohol dehydrogenase family)